MTRLMFLQFRKTGLTKIKNENFPGCIVNFFVFTLSAYHAISKRNNNTKQHKYQVIQYFLLTTLCGIPGVESEGSKKRTICLTSYFLVREVNNN